MTACREFGPGEMIRCPGPGCRGGHGAPLQMVGDGCRARSCIGANDIPRQHSVVKCKECGAQVRIEVWHLDEQGAA